MKLKHIKGAAPAPGTPPTTFRPPRPGETTPAAIRWLEKVEAEAASKQKTKGGQ